MKMPQYSSQLSQRQRTFLSSSKKMPKIQEKSPCRRDLTTTITTLQNSEFSKNLNPENIASFVEISTSSAIVDLDYKSDLISDAFLTSKQSEQSVDDVVQSFSLDDNSMLDLSPALLEYEPNAFSPEIMKEEDNTSDLGLVLRSFEVNTQHENEKAANTLMTLMNWNPELNEIDDRVSVIAEQEKERIDRERKSRNEFADASILVRKLRNREHAKRSRERARSTMENLKKENSLLHGQNYGLSCHIQQLRNAFNILQRWINEQHYCRLLSVIPRAPCSFSPGRQLRPVNSSFDYSDEDRRRLVTFDSRRSSSSASMKTPPTIHLAAPMSSIGVKMEGKYAKLKDTPTILEAIINHVRDAEDCNEDCISPWDVKSPEYASKIFRKQYEDSNVLSGTDSMQINC